MSIAGHRLGEVEPRERAGAQTGRKYEYQYERTARAALDLLADGAAQVCVYCDWHDDYVLEVVDPDTSYVFHQVKGRKLSQGPWSFREFFGVPKRDTAKPSKIPAVVATNTVFPRMILHLSSFGKRCGGLAFVTNSGVDPALSTFLSELRSASCEAELPETSKYAFHNLARAYCASTPPLASSSEDLFTAFRCLAVHTERGQLEDPNAALLEIANVVEEFSEIELLQRQAKQIAREIVSGVRGKVSHASTVVPATEEQLRRDKGIVVAELLGILSLSVQAYEQLKAGEARDTVKTLSRLQRFCVKQNLQNFIVPICEFKAQWDVWRTIERHFLSRVDYMVLEEKARQLLTEGITIQRMIPEAKDIAKQFAGMTATPLTPEHVMGLVFSLAAQSEAINEV
jgi:hypothetical protein